MAGPVQYLVSASGQMSVPAAARRRWGLEHGGRVAVFDLGDAVVILPTEGRGRLIAEALPAEDHLRRVRELADDPDLATT